MKKRIKAGLAAIWFSLSSLLAQGVPEEAMAAFREGNAPALARHMSEEVRLTLQGNSATVDKKKATALLQDFFQTNRVESFTVQHQGRREESSFVIATLATETGPYRVNCFFKKANQQYVIHQIRIEKSNE